MKAKQTKTKMMTAGGSMALAAVVFMPAPNAFAPPATTPYDLTAPGDQTVTVPGDVGGSALFSDFFEQPTGTGVFEPFLTLDSNGQTSTGDKKIEEAYNTDGFTAMYMDQLRPQWNELLKVSDLATITVDTVDYFAFILDANEPGGNKELISIDNIRIYTSATDNTAAVGDDNTLLDGLGTLRWAMNDPLSTGTEPPDLNGFNVDTWVKLDASQENVDQGANNSNGGSGKGDMIAYIPTSAFGTSLGTDDYVWFYNLNGVHYTADKDLAGEAGYEEWRAVVGLTSVPDGGSTLALFGLGLVTVGFLGRNLKLVRAS